MMGTKTLESELQKLNPELYQCYQQTKNIAINHWIPNFIPQKGSFNSYPHIMGVMEHLNIILYDNENSVELNATEIYLLLLAVYLHDIGKANPKPVIDSHGTGSRQYIEEKWAELKIVNKQLAQILKYICDFHDKTNHDEAEKIKQSLRNEIYIDGYGSVRGIVLGMLLFLADHMDGSFTRTAYDELSDSFRSKVWGSRWLPQQKMICTCITYTDFLLPADTKDKDKYKKIEECEKKEDGALYKYIFMKAQEENDKNYMYIDKNSLDYVINDVYVNNEVIKLISDEFYCMGTPIRRWLIECDEQLFAVNMKKDVAKSLQNKVVEIKNKIKNSEDASEKLKNYLNKCKFDNDKIKSNLRIILYDLKQIFDGIDETEYNKLLTTNLTLEPILNINYCTDILKNIKKFNGRIFDKSYHTYEDLVNIMNGDINKIDEIKYGIKRIQLLNELKIDWLLPIDHKLKELEIDYFDEYGFKCKTKRLEGLEKKEPEEPEEPVKLVDSSTYLI